MYQCHFKALSAEPTKWLNNVTAVAKHLHLGWTQLDTKNPYQGPLPNTWGHGRHDALIGLDSNGKFKTSKAAAYPAMLCKAIATAFFDTCISLKSFDKGDAKAALQSTRPISGDGKPQVGDCSSPADPNTSQGG
eukprot:11264381-Karenia_brevis.AAC.1